MLSQASFALETRPSLQRLTLKLAALFTPTFRRPITSTSVSSSATSFLSLLSKKLFNSRPSSSTTKSTAVISFKRHKPYTSPPFANPSMRSNSISSISSVSSVASTEETMQIFVKNVAGDTIPLSVPSTTSISTLKSLLALRTSLPAEDLRLVHAGKHLTALDSTLADCIPREATIHLALPIRGGMAGKRPTCEYKKDTPDKCTSKIQPIVGDCGFCNGHFCSKHRLLESHNCPKLEDCKKESHERNANKLNAERTVAIKGI